MVMMTAVISSHQPKLNLHSWAMKNYPPVLNRLYLGTRHITAMESG